MRRHEYSHRPLKSFLRAVRPVHVPVLLGLAVGGIAVLAMSGGSPVPQIAAPVSVETAEAPAGPRIVLPAEEEGPQRDHLFDIRPAPRREALDLTRRLENAVPQGEPEVDPEVEPVAASATGSAPNIAAGLLPEPDTNGLPMIAVVIDDMGHDAGNSARAVALPAAVTLSYLPYAPSVDAQVREARRHGHQIMLHLPMEANEHRGRGDDKILSVRTGISEIRRQLVATLRRVPAYIGVNNHQGSLFTRDPERMRVVLGELKRRGLFFLDSRTSGGSVGAAVAREMGLSYAVRDVFLDHDPSPGEIRARLADVERIARETGRAVAIGHPRTGTLDLLTPWLAQVEARGFRLVPITEALHRPANRPHMNLLAQSRIAE